MSSTLRTPHFLSTLGIFSYSARRSASNNCLAASSSCGALETILDVALEGPDCVLDAVSVSAAKGLSTTSSAFVASPTSFDESHAPFDVRDRFLGGAFPASRSAAFCFNFASAFALFAASKTWAQPRTKPSLVTSGHVRRVQTVAITCISHTMPSTGL